MYLCQQLEQLTDRRYHLDWRVVFLRVVLDPVSGKLKWERWDNGKWRGPRRVRNDANGFPVFTPAQDRAKKDFRKDVAVIQSASHGAFVTKPQATTLTGLLAPVCMDFLMENWNSSPDVVPKPAKPGKPKPTPIALADDKGRKAEARVEEIDRKIARLQKLKKKWEKRAAYYARRAAQLQNQK